MQHSCGNGSCCSPSKLWRQIQTIIRMGSEEDFVRLCGEGRAPHVARVLLSQRLLNDPAMYPASHKHKVLQMESTTNVQRQHIQRLFGSSVRDLNALQMALFLKREFMARCLLEFLQQQVPPKDLAQFVNHAWGHRNSSLHLAAYWGMVQVVKLLLVCGADTSLRNTRQRGALDGCTNLACIQLLQQASPTSSSELPTPAKKSTSPSSSCTSSSSSSLSALNDAMPPTPIPTPTMATPLPRTSMLLKKAVQHVAELPMDALLMNDNRRLTPISTASIVDNEDNNNNSTAKPPLVYSSSTSSSSSFSSLSSLSSLEEPASPGSQAPPTPDLVLLDDDDDDDQYRRQYCWTPPSPLTPPSSPLYHTQDERRKIMTFSPNPMDQPASICHRRLLRPPVPLRSPPPPARYSPVTEHNDDNEDDDDGNHDDDDNNDDLGAAIVEPSMASASLQQSSSENDVNKKKLRSSSPKSVRFSPEVILLDACVRGDVEDLMNLIHQYQFGREENTHLSDILQTWQHQYASSYKSSSSAPSMLHIALLHRQEKMAKYLISLGVDVNATDQDGWTPLHYAATLQLWSTVECLAQHPDISLDAKTKNGLKVYDCPRALIDQRRCRGLIERAVKRQQQNHSSMHTIAPTCQV